MVARGAARLLVFAVAVVWFAVLWALPTSGASSKLTGAELCPLNVTDYALKACDCSGTKTLCNPFCAGTFIRCGSGKAVNGIKVSVDTCGKGKYYDFIAQKCVSSRKPSATPSICPGINVTAYQEGFPVLVCTSADCFCTRRAPGRYPNPWDTDSLTYIECSRIKGQVTLSGVVDCNFGYEFRPGATAGVGSCVKITKTSRNYGKDYCRNPGCFCLYRREGLYDNPFDFDQSSAIECDGCGFLRRLLIAKTGTYYDGTKFTKLRATNKGPPSVCALEQGGIRGSGAVLATLLPSLLSATPFPSPTALPTRSPTLVPPGENIIIDFPGTGRSPIIAQARAAPPPTGRRRLHAVAQRGYSSLVVSKGAGIVGSSCTAKGNPCKGKGSRWVVYKCRLVKCVANCPSSAAARKLC